MKIGLTAPYQIGNSMTMHKPQAMKTPNFLLFAIKAPAITPNTPKIIITREIKKTKNGIKIRSK